MSRRRWAPDVQVDGFADVRDARAVRGAVTGVLLALRAHRIGVEVQAVSEAESLRLNRTYRRRPRPGDVLSFPLPGNTPGGCAGDLYLCPALAARGARRHGLAPRRWLAYLAVHGTLHLLGFDHRSAAESRRMDGLARALGRAGAAT